MEPIGIENLHGETIEGKMKRYEYLKRELNTIRYGYPFLFRKPVNYNLTPKERSILERSKSIEEEILVLEKDEEVAKRLKIKKENEEKELEKQKIEVSISRMFENTLSDLGMNKYPLKERTVLSAVEMKKNNHVRIILREELPFNIGSKPELEPNKDRIVEAFLARAEQQDKLNITNLKSKLNTEGEGRINEFNPYKERVELIIDFEVKL